MLDFLTQVFRDSSGWLEMRFISDKKVIRHSVPITELSAVPDLVAPYNGTYACYFGLCPRKTQDGKSTEDVAGISVFWCDLDAHEKSKQSKEEIWQFIQALEFKPSIVVDSGLGFHLYYLLDAFYPLPDEQALTSAGALSQAFSRKLGSDSTFDLARIFRLPKTMNIKPGVMRSATIVNWHPEIRYTVSDIKGFVGFDENQVKPRYKTNITRTTYLYPEWTVKKALKRCEFFSYCRGFAEHLPEPIWYAMITSLIRYEGGEKVIHDLSAKDPRYRYEETQKKIIHATTAGLPHTCRYLMDIGYGFDCSQVNTCPALSPARYGRVLIKP